MSTAKADFPIELSIELSYGRSLKRIPGAWFSVDRYEPIKGLPSGSVYVEAVYFEAAGSATGDAHNWIVVKRGTLVVTLKATVEVVPKKAMLLLAKTIDARVK